MQLAPPDSTSRDRILRHCLVHSIVSAVPSFALAILLGWRAPAQIFGMLVGIAAFIASAVIVHLSKPLVLIMRAPVSSRALNWAKIVRLVHAILVLPCFFVPALAWIIFPDFWAGVVANLATNALGFKEAFTLDGVSAEPTANQFAQACLATFIEGWILAGAVAVLCFVVWLFLRLFHLVRSRQG